LSIVTIIIDEKRSQPLKLQQQHNKLYRKLMKADFRNRSPALHHFQTNSKGFGNINLSVDEAGDIFCGWSNDGLIRISEEVFAVGLLMLLIFTNSTNRNLINKNYENKNFSTAITSIFKRIYSANHSS
jgi:hypothetical protein